jgi:hypothetical protein
LDAFQPAIFPEVASSWIEGSHRQTFVGDCLNQIYNVAAGLDVHKASISACVATKLDGRLCHEVREFDTFKCSLRSLAEWLILNGVEAVAMESTGVYWKSPYRILHGFGLNTLLVNAYMVKHVPGRKTDTADCQWLANLTMAGLLRKSRVLNRPESELRSLSRLRQSHVKMVTAFKNRGYKLLIDAGFNVSVVLSELYGATGRLVMAGLMTQTPPGDIICAIIKNYSWISSTPTHETIAFRRGRGIEGGGQLAASLDPALEGGNAT